MNVITRGIRNAFRNWVRTFSIVFILALSIGLALTMLVARQAVTAKIASVKGAIGNTITISPAGARGFEGGGNPLTETELAKVKSIAHVVSLTETIQDRLESTDTNLQSAIAAGSIGRRFGGGGEGGQDQASGMAAPTSFTPPITVLGANNLDASVLTGGGSVSLTSGQKFDPTKDADVALLGKDLATKNNLTIGSTFTAYNGTTITVDGIYDSGNTFSNNTVVMPLPTVQRLSGQTGDISSAVVQVDSISNLTATTTAIKNTLGTDVADVVSQQDTSQQALAPLENIKTISAYSLVGSVVAGAVIILLTMMMIVRERRREIGVLKAIGSSNLKVVTQFMTEAITFTLMAAVIGLVVGALAGNPVTKLLVTTSSTTQTVTTGGARDGGFRGGGAVFRAATGGVGRAAGFGGQSLRNIQTSVGWSIILYGLAAALIIALVGSAIPAWLIAKVRPAEVMRAE